MSETNLSKLQRQWDNFMPLANKIVEKFERQYQERFKQIIEEFKKLGTEAGLYTPEEYFKHKQDFVYALKKFNLNADRLKNEHPRFWKAVYSNKELVDVELIKGFCLQLRYFLEDSEKMSIQQIAKTYEKLGLQSEQKEQFLTKWRNFKSFMENELINIKVSGINFSTVENNPYYVTGNYYGPDVIEALMNFEDTEELKKKYNDTSVKDFVDKYFYGEFSHQNKNNELQQLQETTNSANLQEYQEYQEKINNDTASLEEYQKTDNRTASLQLLAEYMKKIADYIFEFKTINELAIEKLEGCTDVNFLKNED